MASKLILLQHVYETGKFMPNASVLFYWCWTLSTDWWYINMQRKNFEKKSLNVKLFSKIIFPRFLIVRFDTFHCWYIEPWNREKILRLIWQCFSCLLDEWIAKIWKKKNSRWLFEIIHIIRFEIWDLKSRDLKKNLGYHQSYIHQVL